MTETLAPVIRLPLPRPTAKPGDRIRCAAGQGECLDFKALLVCSTAFWQRGIRRRRYSNVVRDLRRMMDGLDAQEGLAPDPRNHAAARRWVDQAIAAKHSPLSVIAA